MKKIVYLISTLHRTGPTNVLAGIIKNLDRTRFTPVVITLSREPDLGKSWWPELEYNGVELYSLNLSRWQNLFVGNKKLEQLVNKIKPDLVHCHCFRSAVMAAKVLKEYNKVVTIHCDYDIDFKMAYGKIQGFLMSYFYSHALYKFDKRVACSKMLANLLNRKYPNMKFDFVDNGVDTEKFCPAKNKTALRKKLGLPLDQKIVIWSGAFIPRKAPLTMVQAIKQMPQDKYFFIFCGNGLLSSICREELKNRKDVSFTGYITNIEEYYQASDIYISTSLSEGLPLAVLEAMSCGLPCVLSDIAQHRYILEEQENITFLYKFDAQSLVKQIENIAQKYSSEFSYFARELVLNKFSSLYMANKYRNFYDKI